MPFYILTILALNTTINYISINWLEIQIEMPENIESFLKQHPKISEAYLLVYEIRIFLNCNKDFHPELRIKVEKNISSEKTPYTCKLSHYPRTPTQAGTYFPDVRPYESESAAISSAIQAVTIYIDGAIEQGYEPSSDWLIPNENW